MANNPHLAPRTIREWLELIPFDRARKEAIENYDDEFYAKKEVNCLSYALIYAFSWRESKQGISYWSNLYGSISHMEISVKLKQ